MLTRQLGNVRFPFENVSYVLKKIDRSNIWPFLHYLDMKRVRHENVLQNMNRVGHESVST